MTSEKINEVVDTISIRRYDTKRHGIKNEHMSRL